MRAPTESFQPPIRVTGFQDSDASNNFTPTLPESEHEIFRKVHLQTPLKPQRDTEGGSLYILPLVINPIQN